jgi:acetyltransferase
MKESSKPQGALAHDVLGWQRQSLQGLFAPASVALIGASEKPGSVGQALLANLAGGPFGERFYPVNPKHPKMAGLKAYKALAELPETPDLVVLATPAPGIPALIQQAADKGVKNAIIISAGFKERGPSGVALESQVQAIARKAGMRVLGPNCLGLMRPPSGLNATFAVPMARPGKVAFLSQSGALLSSILDWSLKRHVGFSAFVSMGSMLDLGWAEMFDYLASDPQTKSILVYMESIGDARSFMSAAREVALTKPIIVLKAGRSAAGAQAAASHTGSLTGSDDVLDAAFKRCGVLRVNSIAELFNMAEALDKQPRPRGKRLAIITNAGGPGVLATDALLENGGEVAALDPATLAALDKVLPEHWSHGDPVDVLGDAGPERYAKSLEIVAKDPGADGMMVILTPQAMSDAAGTAKALALQAQTLDKPVLASWMGGEEAGKGEAVLKAAGIPCFYYPDTAARTFNHLWRYNEELQSLYETPQKVDDGSRRGREAVTQLLKEVRASGRCIMTETESKGLLSAYGISVVETRVAATPDAAVRTAEDIGYPVVLKLNSLTITHKTDVGGVKLNLKDAAAVRAAFSAIKAGVEAKHGSGHFDGVAVQPMLKLEGYELILGASVDPQFGPVLLFGTGGELVEVFKDRALGLPPLNSTLARRMIEQSRIYKALQGVRGRKAVDLQRLEEIMVELSQLILDHPCIKELDLNPLLAGPQGILALDARVILHDASVPDAELPKAAIRPYPAQYASTWKTRMAKELVLRPIRPEDEPAMAAFHAGMEGLGSYHKYLQRLHLAEGGTHEKLLRLCMNDFDRQITLVAEAGKQIVGVGRLTREMGGSGAEFALQVAADWQGQGLGKQLMKRLLAVAEAEGLRRIHAGIFQGEEAMLSICKKLGFKAEPEGEVTRVSLELAVVKA